MKVAAVFMIPTKDKTYHVNVNCDSFSSCKEIFVKYVEQLNGKKEPPSERGATAIVYTEKEWESKGAKKPGWTFVFGPRGGLYSNELN